MKPAIIYARVSTTRQAEEGVSLASQKLECERYCKRRKWEVAAIYIEAGVSGRTQENRTELAAAIAHVCEAKGVLVFYSLSRFARSTHDAITLSDKIRACGGEIASVTDEINTATAHGAFYYTLLAALARLESDIISERVKASNDYTVKTKGHRTQGAQPFGVRVVDGELVKIPEEQEIIATVKRYYRANRKRYYATSQALNADGIPTPAAVRKGIEAHWYPATVAKIVNR